MTLVRSLSRRDIAGIASRSAFARGEAYVLEGRVLSSEVTAGGKRIDAVVHGQGREVYSVVVDIEAGRNGRYLIDGECTCPVGYNCKHVVAALLDVSGLGAKEETAPRHRPGTAPPSLTAELARWMDSLARLRETETDDYPSEIRQRLIYVFDFDVPASGGRRLAVRPVSVRLRKDGSFADNGRQYDIGSAPNGQPAKFIRPADRAILAQLRRMQFVAFAGRGVALTGEDGAAALAAMIATGRARWGTTDGAVLVQGPPRTGAFGWQLAADGTYRTTLEPAPDAGGGQAVPLAPPWYVDPQAGIAGPLETGFPPRLAETIFAVPPVPARELATLRAAFERRLPAFAALRPPEAGPPQRLALAPTPGVRLLVLDLPRPSYYGYGWGDSGDAQRHKVAVMCPFFRYGPHEMSAQDQRNVLVFAHEGRAVEVERRRDAERAARARLDGLGLVGLGGWYVYEVPASARGGLMLPPGRPEGDWADILFRDLPALRADGWIVEVASDFPVRLAEPDGDIAAELREGSGIDWLELDLGVMVDGERVDLVPLILGALGAPDVPTGEAAGRPIYLPLPDGRTLAMPAERLRPILAALRELFGAGGSVEGGKLRFSPFDAADLAGLEAATAAVGVIWQGGERLREMGRMLRETGGIPCAAIPADFAATLRPYQAHGVDWLQFLRAAGLGGVLADDMGLGKTVQALAHLLIERTEGRMDRPSLVVAPTSLMANWRREAERFAPGLRVLTLHGPDRKARFAEIAGHDLVLTTYPLVARDHQALAAQPWHLVILDEAQVIKNPNAATTRLVGTLEARHRLCLTGTPLENHLGELWSLFAFLSPGFLGDRQGFTRRWRTPIEKRGDEARRLQLARRVRPFLLRRTKAEVAAELPPKTEIVETVEMERAQRELYDTIRMAMHDKVRRAIAAQGLARSHIVVLDALLKLRQACCDPRLLKLASAKAMKAGSAKLDRLMEMLPALVEEGRRVLLFSQFTSMLALIERALGEATLPYVLLTGSTRDRATPIRRFQDGEVPLFLVSLKAGGVGLNLTAADTVIHYDPWWNPAVEDQATDRAHRIGQTRPVFVHKLVVAASIEEKMESLKSRKRHLAAGLFDPEAGSPLDLTEADIDGLLGPA